MINIIYSPWYLKTSKQRVAQFDAKSKGLLRKFYGTNREFKIMYTATISLTVSLRYYLAKNSHK